ncbi:MAG: hypothetical protein M0R68_10450, partial [Bacteroidetes bacterium]|nr:hypothetical protein [Bacteroidota bacterium]
FQGERSSEKKEYKIKRFLKEGRLSKMLNLTALPLGRGRKSSLNPPKFRSLPHLIQHCKKCRGGLTFLNNMPVSVTNFPVSVARCLTVASGYDRLPQILFSSTFNIH